MDCGHAKSRAAKRCRSCNLKAMWADPDFRARKARSNAATLERLRQDPAFVERENERRRAACAVMNASGRKSDPDVIARRSRTFSSRRLSWCPPHLRREYIRLMTHKHLKAIEAKEVIMDQWRAELARRANAARAV